MIARRVLPCLLIALLPMSAFAQLDDLLTPLAPEKKEAPKKKKAPKKERVSKKKQVKEKEQAPVDDPLLAPLVPQKATLWVKVSGPQDAAITIDGQKVKSGQKLEVDAGEHTVVVRRPGFSEVNRKVKVTTGQALEIPAALDAVAGVLTVTADVPGSDVLVDGDLVGQAPVTGHSLSPGSHEIVVRKDGFEDSVSNLSVRAGRDYTVTGNLKPKEGVRTLAAVDGDRPEATRLVPDDTDPTSSALDLTSTEPQRVENPAWYQRWYVWAGAGAVVAAAVTTAVVTSNNARNSSISPTDVCGGPCDDVINAPSALRF